MNIAPLILVIDDEPQIQRALRTILSAQKYRVALAGSGEDGLAVAAAEQPDVIVLDLGLPDMDGTQVTARLREWTQTPIIILSVRDSEREKVKALDLGADDFLVKPFGIEELLARIRAALRHSILLKGAPEMVIKTFNLEIDLSRHLVFRDGAPVNLTATEFKLLAYLANHAGRVLTHRSLLEQVWGFEYIDNIEYLRVYMSQLRHKLEENPKAPRILLSEPGVGYRFVVDL